MSLDPMTTPSGEHQHHHHHHHHHLTRLTGKGSEATGKRVLVGVDGSDHSNYACQWYFSHLWSSEDYVVLLNCPDLQEEVKNHWSGGVKYVFDRELVDQKLREGEEQVHGQLEQFKDILLQHSAHGKVRAVSAKNPGDAILKTADEEKCDLIVIGCKGRSAFRRTLLGTISDHVVHHANVPVVVCRNKMLRRKSSAIVPPNPEELQVSGK
ncbi:universal stress protein PHOS32 [Biomphalaria pfeifferi]|uniref:Universal stress protein PHOS32 n=1 Tax=Biomphalaria pfeifferi TaxID=112525 RepID=A0AAD8ASK7_BIOPF|nr:universal stress protein PHOS32 [Biomphalaria glabrata]KAK0041669.1 universal stress protein PHOS32 [Biomphalaria pfeifferi]